MTADQLSFEASGQEDVQETLELIREIYATLPREDRRRVYNNLLARRRDFNSQGAAAAMNHAGGDA